MPKRFLLAIACACNSRRGRRQGTNPDLCWRSDRPEGSRAQRNVHRAPHLVRRGRRAGISPAFAAYCKSGSGTTRPRSPRETQLSSHPQGERSDGGSRVIDLGRLCQTPSAFHRTEPAGAERDRRAGRTTERAGASESNALKNLATRHLSLRANLPMISADAIAAADFATKKNSASQESRSIAGIDESGRGALAGPVVAAATILP